MIRKEEEKVTNRTIVWSFCHNSKYENYECIVAELAKLLYEMLPARAVSLFFDEVGIEEDGNLWDKITALANTLDD